MSNTTATAVVIDAEREIYPSANSAKTADKCLRGKMCSRCGSERLGWWDHPQKPLCWDCGFTGK